MTTLDHLQTLEGHTDRVWGLAWSPSGKILASCGGDKTIRIWARSDDINNEITPLVCKAVLEGGHQRTIRSIAWSPDGKYLASASFDATVSIWALKQKGKDIEFDCIATLEGHENEVKSVSWDASGALLATCSRDKSVWIWEMQSDNEFECISVLHGHSQDVKAVLWHPVKEILFSCSYDDTVKVWQDDEDDWYCSHTLPGHTSTVWDLAFDKDGNRLASCSDDNNLIIWNTKHITEGPKKLCTITGYHKRTIFSVDWSNDDLIATGAADDTIRVFMQDPRITDTNAPSFMQILSQHKAHSADINCVSWNPAFPSLLASCGDDQIVKIWRIEGVDKSIM